MKDWHSATPGSVGLGENRILQGTGIKLAGHVAAAIAAELVRDGALVREDLGVRLPSHSARLQGADAKLWPKVEQIFSQSKLRPLTAREVAAACDLDFKKMEALLNRAGRLGSQRHDMPCLLDCANSGILRKTLPHPLKTKH